MDTPICDFIQKYIASNTLRLHMPGHKGVPLLGVEPMDITEIAHADSLYEAEGIIKQSESNASKQYGCRTLYSTEGSSQCIRAMLYLILSYAQKTGGNPIIAAVRNVHKTFLTAAALLDLDVQWLYPKENAGYLSCNLTAEELDNYLKNSHTKPVAVYLTSPDYLGNIADIGALADICHKHNVLLAVDNAHGAYLKFLSHSLHPMDLGADLCCDSAHKTLPALTGGAYLHLSSTMDALVGTQAKNALMLFGSTSPSYLILQSLDAVNVYLEDYPKKLNDFIIKVDKLREQLQHLGYCLYGNEPLKITIDAKVYGYTGIELADYLRQHHIEPEFSDPDYLVLMLTPEITENALIQIENVFCQLPKRTAIEKTAPILMCGEKRLEIRKALLSDSQILPAKQCIGKILAVPTVGCPPAVPILVCGEEITEHALSCFSYYGITHCCVVKE